MANYYYILSKKTVCNHSLRHVIYFSKDNNMSEDIQMVIFNDILEKKREARFNKLSKDHCGDDDMTALRKKLCSLNEIREKYEITNIELAPSCCGCLNDCCGQNDHMECPTGCLHDKESCSVCN